MATEWEQADQPLIALADRVIREYRPQLVNARIGFLFRSEPGKSQGKSVIGKAQKVSSQMEILLDLDFIIWISKPDWLAFDTDGRTALLHHELCHCEEDTETDEWKIVAHDMEEFHAVIRAHGLWQPALVVAAQAIQPHLPGLEAEGKVTALKPELAAAGLS